MKTKPIYLVSLISSMLMLVLACGENKTESSSEKTYNLKALPEAEQKLIKQATAIFGQLPDSVNNLANPLNENKISLGKALYYDARLSKSGVLSCNSCHHLASYGVDNLPTSPGHKWQFGARNSPTTLNAALHFTQFWDGRAADLEAQAEGPILNPIEMATPHEDFAVERIQSIEGYQDWFKQAFPEEANPLTYKNIAKAIAAFERTLLTPTRFDEYLKGDADALTSNEKKGLETFINSGCVSCHMGPALGGKIFQKFGVKKDYWTATGSTNKDAGRFEVTKKEEDKYFFKVPGLRNVVQTYPYFHDGSVWDLKQVIAIMGEVQLGKTYSQEEVNQMVSFLKSLTGTLPEHATILPTLPPSSATTSKPIFN